MSPKAPMEESVESNSFEKFKAILHPYFRSFLRKSSKPGCGNVILTTSTVQVELQLWWYKNYNFLQVLTY